MLLTVPVLIALIAALIRGGSLRHLAALPLRGIPFIFAALAIQIALYLPGVRTSPLAHDYGPLLYVIALLLALAGAIANWRLGPALWIATLGLALNTLVIAANGGYMPTDGHAMQSVQGAETVREIKNAHLYGNVRLAGPRTRLVFLSDIIPVRFPNGPGNVYSIGDVLLVIGIAALVYQAARRPYPSWQAPGDVKGYRREHTPSR